MPETQSVDLTAIREIVSAEAKKHPQSIESATEAAMLRIRKLPQYAEFVESLAERAVREMISVYRHATNVAIKNDEGAYGGPAKVVAGKATAEVMACVYYEYRIGGTILGMVMGKELPGLAELEESKVEGHRFRAMLCRELIAKVPPDKRVKQCLTNRQLGAIFNRLQKKQKTMAAA